MKIALLIERMDVLRGGRETYTAQVAAELARRGGEVSILCQDGSWQCEGVQIVRLGRRGWTRSGRMAAFLDDAGRYLAAHRFDVTHAMLAMRGVDIYHPHGGTVPSSAAAQVRRRSGIVRGLYGLGSLFNLPRRQRLRLEREIAADPGVVCLCVSELVAAQFRRDYGRSENVRVIFNGVGGVQGDLSQRMAWRREVRERLGLADDETLFLVVATNFELKGVGETIRAMAKWTRLREGRPGGALAVVGRQRVAEYRRLAEELGLGGRVHFEPPTREIHQWYAGADAMVLLTWYDPCSLVVLEAVRWHLPALTTAFNGAAGVLGEGAGIVVDSPRCLAEAVIAMDDLADPLRRQMRIDACVRIEEGLSIRRHVDELESLYREVASRKRPAI